MRSNRKKVMLTKDVPLNSHLAHFTFCKLDNFFLLDLESLKTVLLVAFYGVVKDRFFKLKVSQ